jgi:DEAD/DEAH box helicase domain-containing protein
VSQVCAKLSAVERTERAGGDQRDDRGRRLLDRVVAGIPAEESPLRHVEHFPERPAQHAPWPDWVPEELARTLRAQVPQEPWKHQVEGAEAVRSGRNVVVATGTASGKSLIYQLPVLAQLLDEPKATALYLAPTKALGADQLRAVGDLGLDELRAAAYDGDTPVNERDWVRAHARWIFSNPDMLHHGVLSRHDRWSRFFRNLRHVVVDECHTYRGVFGSHVALLLRRLRRIARYYGSDPVFVLASATVADPAQLGSDLIGQECTAITEDTSPRGARTVALWEPELLEEVTGENGAPVRRSAGAETARIMTELVVEGARTLAFVRSRRGVEIAALSARRLLSDVDSSLPEQVAAYRGGYLPEDRRKLEAALLSGELTAVATTSALELGVDIAGLDAVVVAGYPGTLASFWQQAGRAGRGGEGALVVFVAREDPLDTYLVHHPPAMLERPVEATVLDPANPYVLEPHLACAAAELPLVDESLELLGGGPARRAAEALAADGVLRKRPRGWYWTSRERPHRNVPLRGTGGQEIAVVEGDSGRMLGTVDPDSACSTVHPGAVYLHQGESFVVDELDLEEGLALVRAERPEWTTSPRSVIDIAVLRTDQQEQVAPGVSVALGEVEVTSQVTGYLRKLPSGEVLDQVGLELPAQKLVTRAVWYTLADELLTGSGGEGSAPGGAGLDPARIPGALHAAEHAAIGLLPLFATCDRWDIGGVSTALHEDTGEATVFVHDGHPGGAGFADRGFAALFPWLAATREAIVSCECPAGCPSCVQSPKCGNGNEPLDKAGAVAVLDVMSAAGARGGGAAGASEQLPAG